MPIPFSEGMKLFRARVLEMMQELEDAGKLPAYGDDQRETGGDLNANTKTRSPLASRDVRITRETRKTIG